MKLFKWLKGKFNRTKRLHDLENLDISQREALFDEIRVSGNLNVDLGNLQQMIGPSADIIIRHFKVGNVIPAALAFVDGVNDSGKIETILRSLLVGYGEFVRENIKKETIEELIYGALISVDINEEIDIAKSFATIAGGNCALFVEGLAKILICDTQLIETRSTEEPSAELSIRGIREGFVENIRINTSLIRRRIRSSSLWFEPMTIGSLTKTKIEIAYIKGLVEEDLLDEVRSRLARIDTDSILMSGYLEDYIADDPFSLFPQTKRTERVDVVSAELLEGRIAIFTDGSSFVLLVPVSIIMFLQTPDDYSESPIAGSFFRILRIIALFISVLLPGLYVAILNFHIELLPTDLLLRIMVTREGVPFPVIVEVLVMDFLFEILREAGIRLPDAVGSAVSIVGALILGDAAIRAGLVSPAVVIVIAMTAIANFSTPGFSLAISMRLLRFIFTILGGVFGLFGIQFGVLYTVIHMCGLRSFGMPYLTSIAPFHWSDMKDYFIRFWHWGMVKRPHELGKREPQRLRRGQKPSPPKEE